MMELLRDDPIISSILRTGYPPWIDDVDDFDEDDDEDFEENENFDEYEDEEDPDFN